jgi:tetratricopeptide (TPR) repeat protein
VTGMGVTARRTSVICSGAVPALADGFTSRPESAPALSALVPGTTVAFVPEGVSQSGQSAGSCGKTQLAAYFAHTLWRAGQVEFLAWVDASSRGSVLAGYAQAAAAAGIEVTGPAEQAATRLAGWLAGTPRPWLMVLDDVRDTADLDGLWPCGPAGTVLITTPSGETVSEERDQRRVRIFPVGPFSPREALNYLMGRLAADPDQRHGAIDLALALGGDPMALTHASAVIATTVQSCCDYQDHYTDKLAHLSARQPGGQLPAAHAVTWLLSVERAAELCPGRAVQFVLALAALLDGQAIPAPVLAAPAVGKYLAEADAPAGDGDRAWEAVQALQHTGLVAIDPAPTPSVVRVSLLAAALARAAIPHQVLDRAAVVAADALLEIWPPQEPQPWFAAGLRACAAALQQTAGDRLWAADGCHPLLRKTGHSLDTARLTGPAVRHWTQLATTSDRILGPDASHTLTAGSHLAHALLAAGQASEAVAWWQWVTASRARVSGSDHPDTLAARVNLGHAMAAAGQLDDAIAILELAVADHVRVLRPGHPGTFHAHGELAATYRAAGRTAEAVEHYRCIVADHERSYGALHPGTMTAREQLAGARLADGQLDDAITCYQQTLAGRQHIQGADHLDTITTRRNLAAAYQAAGKITAALQLHEQVCAEYERIVGADHPDTLACRADLVDIYYASGRLADAATLRREILARHKQTPAAGREQLTGNLKWTTELDSRQTHVSRAAGRRASPEPAVGDTR